MKKIDVLINYGLNDIAVFGGFGPDDLDTYFELRRHYKINFSIDAESKLKTKGNIDIEKTKNYLNQLMRFDDPNEAGVEQSRTFLQQNQVDCWSNVKVNGYNFIVHPAVFNPGPFPSTKWFADYVINDLKDKKSFCEIGCGAGVVSCLAALSNKKIKVVSSDINPFATETTKLNAEKLKISKQVSVKNGDVFEGVSKKSSFDVIFWALPFGFLDPGTRVDLREMQLFDPGYRATKKFLIEAKNYLSKDGYVLLGFSDDLGNIDLLNEIANDAGISLEVVSETEIKEKEVLNFQILKGKYIK